MEQVNDAFDFLWECKECHLMILSDENVAYHIVGGALYGWCEACFSQRSARERAV